MGPLKCRPATSAANFGRRVGNLECADMSALQIRSSLRHVLEHVDCLSLHCGRFLIDFLQAARLIAAEELALEIPGQTT